MKAISQKSVICAVCEIPLADDRLKNNAKTCAGTCQRVRNNSQTSKRKYKARDQKILTKTEGSSEAVTLTNATSFSEEKKTTQEVEQTVAFEKKQKSIHSVETSTTVRQVNGGSPETIMETKVVSVHFVFSC